jgi:ribose transport system ATP-binding protein
VGNGEHERGSTAIATEQAEESGRPAVGVSTTAPVLRVVGASKSYGVVQALRDVSLSIAAGEIHALVGENGSGKSTLVGMVSGTVKPDAGTIEIAGTVCSRHTPAESQRARALTVFQDGSVVQPLTIAQNLYLGTPPDQRPAYRQVDEWAASLLREQGLGRLDVRARAQTLSPGDRQLFEMARALLAEPAVLLLDEATSALDAAGVAVALEIMRTAAGRGCAVLFVTHRLSEVFQVAHRISVLRDGASQGTFAPESVGHDRLVELMAGRAVEVEFPPRATSAQVGEIVLLARSIAATGPAELSIRAGEIVGIAGANDNGQLELLRSLAAIGSPTGELYAADGKRLDTYGDSVGAGVLYLSRDRRAESLFAPLAIRENLVVGMLGDLARLGVVGRQRERALVRDTVERLGIRLGSPEDPITSLSGGNQQKVALGRVLATDPDVLLIDEPTQGVDVRSRMDIYRILRGSAGKGLAVVIVSSDAAELAGLCDRVLVVSRGAIVAEIAGADATEDAIVHAFTGAGQASSQRLPGAETVERGAASNASGAPHAWRSLVGFLSKHENAVRLSLLVVLMLGLGAYARSQNSTFLTDPSLSNIFILAAPLAAVAAAEFIVLYVGCIDISVGAAMGVQVVLMSFFVQRNSLVAGLLISLAIALAFGVILGLANATLTEVMRISPVIATIATLGILQGIGLMLRPTAAGSISLSLTDALTKQVWIFPWVLVVLAVIFVLADWVMRSSGYGLRVRAVGMNPQFAYRLGVNAARLRAISYVGCAVAAGFAGIVLAGQVGTGDSTVGNSYTLLAIAAPVLGGASLLGGYGSFVGCLLGAVVLALTQTLPTTLGLDDAASYLLTGGLTLFALVIYTPRTFVRMGSVLRQFLPRTRRVDSPVAPPTQRGDGE